MSPSFTGQPMTPATKTKKSKVCFSNIEITIEVTNCEVTDGLKSEVLETVDQWFIETFSNRIFHSKSKLNIGILIDDGQKVDVIISSV